MKITIPDKLNFSEESWQLFNGFELTRYDDVPKNPLELISRIADANIITANYVDITAEVIAEAKELKYIIAPAVSPDWIDLKAATAKGITVLNCPSYNTAAVAEHALALIFALNRKIVTAHNSILSGHWNPEEFSGNELGSKQLLTIGYGRIGKEIIKLAKGLGMITNYANSSTSRTELEELVKTADIIVIAASLNPSTENMVDKRLLKLFKSAAIIVNVGRGLIIEQDSLYSALINKEIAGAALDVFPNDTTISKPTAQILRFARLGNVIVTPHIGYNTVEANERLAKEIVSNISSCIQGKPLNIIS